MKIEIMIQCYNFQRRLCWMLSSILQQEHGEYFPDIAVNVAAVRGNGEPSVKQVHERLEPSLKAYGIQMKVTYYAGINRYQYRGLTRNDQWEQSDADWALFADTDMVYPPNFFNEAGRLLSTEYKDNPHCLVSQRFSTELAPTEQLVDDTGRWNYPCIIPGVWDRISVLPGNLKTNSGAGYCQIANIPLLRKNFNGLYQNPDARVDWSWEKKYQKAKSDMHFRRRLGRERIPLPVQYHVQHRRDCHEGRRLEIQR